MQVTGRSILQLAEQFWGATESAVLTNPSYFELQTMWEMFCLEEWDDEIRSEPPASDLDVGFGHRPAALALLDLHDEIASQSFQADVADSAPEQLQSDSSSDSSSDSESVEAAMANIADSAPEQLQSDSSSDSSSDSESVEAAMANIAVCNADRGSGLATCLLTLCLSVDGVSVMARTFLEAVVSQKNALFEAQKGQSTSAKEQELQVEEQVRELLSKRAELAIKQEAVAAACSVEKERLTELRNEFEEVRTATSKKIEDATKELAVQECATSLEAKLSQIDMELILSKEKFSADMQALESHKAEAATLRKRLQESASRHEQVLAKAESGPQTNHTKDKDPASEQKTKLLKELLVHRAASLREASKESTEAEKNVQALQQEQRSLQEEYRVVMDEMKSQVSKGNDHYSKLQELEEDIRTFDDESELLTLGLHDAEHRKTFLLQEHALLQKTSGNFHPNLLQQWAKEVLGLRVAAQVKSYEDELEHWKQAASEGQPEAPPNGSSHQKAAEELLRQKAVALEEQLAAKEKQLKEFEKQAQHEEVPGNIRSVPSALHGSLFLGPTMSKMEAVQRRALVIGCNYCSSFAPLQGCANDAWNIQCLLRQSLQYPESQVRCLIDFSDSTASPPKRRPTRENIIAELQWLTQSAKPGDNVLFYFSGYGAQQPESQTDGLYEGHLVPMDFADNFPEDIVHELRHCNTSADSRLSPDSAQRAVQAGGYRLVPMSLITSALHSLPPTCKVTILLDCCQSSVVALLRHSEARSLGPGPGPPLFKRLAPNVQEIPADAVSSAKIRLLNLPPLPGGHSLARQMVSPSSSPSRSSTHSPHHMSSPASEAQPSPLEATQRHGSVARGGPSCKCYSFATCQNDQVCCELPIEGCVQGAGTWAFVKAVAACHFSVSLAQHSKATDSILQNLRRKYRWIQQTPVIQLSASANVEDTLILP
eukprot:s1277_g5.t2